MMNWIPQLSVVSYSGWPWCTSCGDASFQTEVLLFVCSYCTSPPPLSDSVWNPLLQLVCFAERPWQRKFGPGRKLSPFPSVAFQSTPFQRAGAFQGQICKVGVDPQFLVQLQTALQFHLDAADSWQLLGRLQKGHHSPAQQTEQAIVPLRLNFTSTYALTDAMSFTTCFHASLMSAGRTLAMWYFSYKCGTCTRIWGSCLLLLACAVACLTFSRASNIDFFSSNKFCVETTCIQLGVMDLSYSV